MHRLTHRRRPGPVLQVLDLGATVHRLKVTGGDGVRRNVVLGHAAAQEHLDSTHYLGGTIGRYANRIAGAASPSTAGRCASAPTTGATRLHGGPDGFDRRLWSVVEQRARTTCRAAPAQPRRRPGLPGRARGRARGSRSTATRVRVELEATTDATTVVNLTSHAYLNLDGEGSGTVDEHLLTSRPTTYLPSTTPGSRSARRPGGGHAVRPARPTPLGARVRAQHPQVVGARGHRPQLRRRAATGWRVVATAGLAAHQHPDGAAQRPAGAAGLHGQRPRRRHRLDRGGALPPGRRPRAGAPAVPGQPQPARVASPVLRPGETYRAALEWRFLARKS